MMFHGLNCLEIKTVHGGYGFPGRRSEEVVKLIDEFWNSNVVVVA